MIKRFEDKPSIKTVEKYRKELERFLSVNNIKIEIEVLETPIELFVEWVGDENSRVKTSIWYMLYIIFNGKKILYSTPTRFGIDDSITDLDIYYDAVSIKDFVYKEFNIEIDNKFDNIYSFLPQLTGKKVLF